MENTTTNPEMEPSNGADTAQATHSNQFVRDTDLTEKQTTFITEMESTFKEITDSIIESIPETHQRQLSLDAFLVAHLMLVRAVTHG